MRNCIALLIFILCLLGGLELSAQKSTTWVLLLDEKDAAAFPALSSTALENRQRMGIPLDERDLPVNKKRMLEICNHSSVRIKGVSRWLNAAIIESELSPENLTLLFPWNKGLFKPALRCGVASVSEKTPCTNDIAPNKIAADYGFALIQTQQVGLDCLHNKGYTGENVTVAVLDSGFKNADQITAFDSLRLQNRIIVVYDFVNQDQGIYDEDNHGMQVLSVMAARRSGSYKGSAWKSNYLLGRTETIFSETAAEETNWLMGMEWADSLGARVIQSSLGYNRYDGGMGYVYSDLDGKTALISKAASIAVQKGLSVIVSAGNEGSNSWMYVTVPADADSILAVGSVDNTGDRTGFSSIGPTADGRIKPDVMAMGESTAIFNTSGMVSNASGTSFAAPIIAGITACLTQAHPTRSGFEIMEAIRKSGDRALNPDNQYGFGIPNACMADSLLSVVSQQKNTEVITSIAIYPNPASEMITIVNSDFYSGPIKIFNSAGILVLSENKNKINIKHLESGIYWVRVPLDSGKFRMIKLMKD